MEPHSVEQLSEFDIARYYNYYRINYTEKDARNFLCEFVKSTKKQAIINSQSYIPLAYGWLARIITNGNKVPVEYVDKLNHYIESIKLQKRKVEKPTLLPTISAERKNKNKENDAYSFLETLIDKLYDTKGKHTISAESTILMYGLSKSNTQVLAENLEQDHLRDLRNIPNDEDLQEGYSFLTKRQLNIIFKNLKQVKEELLSVKNIVTSENKKTRAIKLKPISEIIKNIKFKNEVYGLSTVEIKHLLGKRVAYVVSDAKRTMLRLESKSGFDARSSFLTNVDSAEKIIVYGRYQESAAIYLAKAKTEKDAKNLKKHIRVRRYEPIEIKNNEYRTTDKFCVIQNYLDL